MDRVKAYCSTCDASVEIEVTPNRTLDPTSLACPHLELCEPGECFLRQLDRDQLLEHLEFVPGGEGRATLDLEDATLRVDSGRRLSLGRELRRWKRWRKES